MNDEMRYITFLDRLRTNEIEDKPSGSIIWLVIKGWSASIFLSKAEAQEKNSIDVWSFCFVYCCARVRQGIIWPPDLPATKQVVDVLLMYVMCSNALAVFLLLLAHVNFL